MVLLSHTKTKVKGDRSVHVAAGILNLLTFFFKFVPTFPWPNVLFIQWFSQLSTTKKVNSVSDVYVFVCQDLID